MGDVDDINTAKFAEFMAYKLGTRKWTVSAARTMSGQMKALGYVKTITHAQLDAFKQEFAERHQ